MARIAGVDLPRDKRVEIGLTYIYGIGLSSSQEILAKTGINPDTRVRDLTEDEVQKIRETIGEEYKVEGDLRRETALNIKRLIEVNVIVRVCPFAVSARRRMLVLVKVREKRLQVRRNNI